MTTLLVTIALALIGASVTFVGAILSKEQKISEFRLDWLEALRSDIASLLARALAIHSAHRATGGNLVAGSEFGLKVREDYLEVNQTSIRVRLRLNPLKESHKAVITLMDEIEDLFGHGLADTPFEKIDGVVSRITIASQQLLRSVWEEVKVGEPAFRRTKWTAVWVALLALLLLIWGIVFQIRQSEMISPSPCTCVHHGAGL